MALKDGKDSSVEAAKLSEDSFLSEVFCCLRGQYNLHARYQGALSKLASANNRASADLGTMRLTNSVSFAVDQLAFIPSLHRAKGFAKRTKATQRNSDRTAPWHVLESSCLLVGLSLSLHLKWSSWSHLSLLSFFV